MSAEVCPSEASADAGTFADAGASAEAEVAPAGPAGEVLAPLAARYGGWLRLPAARTSDTSDEAPGQVRAMPVVLRVERATPPERTPLLEAAASAAVAVCLDPRAGAGGEWHDAVASWVGGRIRKVSRRARGAHWAAVRELPGVTVAVPSGTGVAEVRALVPGLVAEMPKEVSRLQIAGTDLPLDQPGSPAAGQPVIWLNPAVELTVGKAAAQVGHASMILAATLPVADLATWYAAGLRCAVRVASERRWREVLDAAAGAGRSGGPDRSTVLVRDAGFTEVAPGTVTCAAQWLPA